MQTELFMTEAGSIIKSTGREWKRIQRDTSLRVIGWKIKEMGREYSTRMVRRPSNTTKMAFFNINSGHFKKSPETHGGSKMGLPDRCQISFIYR